MQRWRRPGPRGRRLGALGLVGQARGADAVDGTPAESRSAGVPYRRISSRTARCASGTETGSAMASRQVSSPTETRQRGSASRLRAQSASGLPAATSSAPIGLVDVAQGDLARAGRSPCPRVSSRSTFPQPASCSPSSSVICLEPASSCLPSRPRGRRRAQPLHVGDRPGAERGHRLAERADEVLRAVGHGRRAEQDLLERAHGPDLDPRAPRQRRRGRGHAPVRRRAPAPPRPAPAATRASARRRPPRSPSRARRRGASRRRRRPGRSGRSRARYASRAAATSLIAVTCGTPIPSTSRVVHAAPARRRRTPPRRPAPSARRPPRRSSCCRPRRGSA